jgi:molybdate transport system substrate-binding protein
MVLLNTVVMAADIKVFSAGAIEPGLLRVIEAFKAASANEVRILFNTPAQISQRLAQGEIVDIVIATPPVMEEQAKNGNISADGQITIGRVGVGVVVRNDVANPDVATEETLKQAVLRAQSLVYNTASTGTYMDKLFARMGIAEQIKAKTTRPVDGEQVMLHLLKGKGNEIGFGALTEIKLFEPKGLKLVAPLPREIQNYTTYRAALMPKGPSPTPAKAFLTFLASGEAKDIFAAAGIE